MNRTIDELVQPVATVLCQSTAMCRAYNADFHRDSASALRPCLQNQGNVRGLEFEVAQGRSTQECFQKLREACGDAALSYRTVVRRVNAFLERKVAVQNNLRTGRPHMENNIAQFLASVLGADRRRSVLELGAEV